MTDTQIMTMAAAIFLSKVFPYKVNVIVGMIFLTLATLKQGGWL